MEFEKNKLYIRVAGNLITEIWTTAIPPSRVPDASDILADESDIRLSWILLADGVRKEIGGASVFDDFGVPLYEWTGESIRERTEEERMAERPPHTLKAADAIAQSHRMLVSALETPLLYLDGRRYTVTLEKQKLLSVELGLYMMNSQIGIPATLMWNATGAEREPWGFDDLLKLSNAINAYARPMVDAQQHVEVMINASTSAEGITAALEGYNAALESLIGDTSWQEKIMSIGI